MSLPLKEVKPLFKYIGGKTWLKEELRKELQSVLNNNQKIITYVEPFAGGLGAFLGVYDILISHHIKNVILSDINLGLINLYNHIDNQKDELIKEIISIEQGFSSTIPQNIKTITNKEEIKKSLIEAENYFKKIRQKFNKNKGDNNIQQSARLVFLQKHSFNGVYRENSKGEYNTPFNWSASSMIHSIEEKINELHDVFKLFNIQFNISSYDNINYNQNTAYYLDPPYINELIVENKYHKEAFGLKEQLKLISKIENLNFIYSNHYSELLVTELNKNKNIQLKKIARKNIISALAESRQNNKIEILATNKTT